MADSTINVTEVTDSAAKLIRLKDNGDSTYSISTADYANWLTAGHQFVYSEIVDAADSAVRNILIKTPNTVLWSYLLVTVESSLEADYKLYETAVTTGDGTALTALNRNRNSATAATSVLTHTPTIAGGSEGTLLVSRHWLSGKGTDDSERWLLKQNTKYLIRVTNSTSSVNKTNIIVDWYEH